MSQQDVISLRFLCYRSSVDQLKYKYRNGYITRSVQSVDFSFLVEERILIRWLILIFTEHCNMVFLISVLCFSNWFSSLKNNGNICLSYLKIPSEWTARRTNYRRYRWRRTRGEGRLGCLDLRLSRSYHAKNKDEKLFFFVIVELMSLQNIFLVAGG